MKLHIVGRRKSVFGNIEWSGALMLLGIVVFIFAVNHFFKRSRWTVFAIAFPTLIFIKLSEELLEKELYKFDSVVYGFISKFISQTMTGLMKLFTFMGSAPALILISLVLLAFLWKSKEFRFIGLMIIVNLSATSVLDEIFKRIFQRPRPDILRLVPISGYSFPSGHSMTSISFYGLAAYLCLKYIRKPYKFLVPGLLVLLVQAIGISRIYLGVHYASDVIAGFAAGMAWLAIFITLINRFRSSRNKPSLN